MIKILEYSDNSCFKQKLPDGNICVGTTSSGKEQANDAQNALMHSLQAVNLKWYEAIQGLIHAALQFCMIQTIVYQYKWTGKESKYLAHNGCWY